ncbi:hypothetical protein C2845_PM01G05360 [Panicum miliaceum]|uniref:Uncharacterized protein n=1 Tax=Panicum miliaceum TaxID=4540 RepID=A0A3L6TQ19_PANMI|nr:hypothetical protein C2845_PM01G05360 [Panicum miliaceum]
MTVDVDSKELKRQRELAQSASLTQGQKNERNRKRRETYRRKKEITKEKESKCGETEYSLHQTIQQTEIIALDSGNNLSLYDISSIQEENNEGVPDTVVSSSAKPTDPKERNRERVRAQRASLSTGQRALINQHHREAYHAKKTQWTTAAIEPYIESSSERETAPENKEIHCSPKPLRKRVTHGERNTLQKCRNTEFQATGAKKRVVADGVDNNVGGSSAPKHSVGPVSQSQPSTVGKNSNNQELETSGSMVKDGTFQFATCVKQMKLLRIRIGTPSPTRHNIE